VVAEDLEENGLHGAHGASQRHGKCLQRLVRAVVKAHVLLKHKVARVQRACAVSVRAWECGQERERECVGRERLSSGQSTRDEPLSTLGSEYPATPKSRGAEPSCGLHGVSR
jgi:hypothetical protein